MVALMPARDSERLQSLRATRLLDSPPEEAFDRLTRLAARVLRVPVALVSLVDAERQFFKSQVGLAEPWATQRGTPLSHSFCQHVVAGRAPLVVEDAPRHPLVRDNPAIVELGIVAYAGIPLVLADDQVLGALCAIDTRPRVWTSEELGILADLAAAVVAEIERRCAAAAKRARFEASEARLRALLGGLDAVVLELDPATFRATFVNAATETLLGRSAAWWLAASDPWSVVLHPDDRAAVLAECAGALAAGRGHDLEYRMVAADGSIRWVHDVTTLRLDADGTPERLLTVLVDVTDRRRVDAALRESEERLRLVTRATQDPLWDWDLGTDTRWWNDGVRTLFGYAAGEVGEAAAWWTARIHPEDRARVLDGLLAAIARGDASWSDEYRFLRADGAAAHVLDRGYLVYDAAGAPKRMVGAMIDLTERKAAEEERARQAETLTRSEKLRALGQMAGGIAHDLNQSLSLVATLGELARRELARPAADVARAHEMLGTVVQAAFDGGEAVQHLLMFARTREEGAAQPLLVADVLHEVVQLTAPQWRDAAQAEGRSITLRVDAPEEVVLSGYPAALRQALTNLVFNAVDALPTGGTIDLAARRCGELVEITVADDGVGMPPEVRARAFEPFFTTKQERGTGLGLAQVFTIAERHGGRVDIASEPGAGTRITLALPRGEPQTADTARAEAATRARPLQVLVVDDQAVLARAASLVLAGAGHSTTTVNAGGAAIECLEREAFDVVVTDLGMAGMNGWDLAAAVKDSWPETRVVLVTGWGAEIDPTDARTRGVDAVVAKPYRGETLRGAVEAT
jgi:PAS domain S-box-containing protein